MFVSCFRSRLTRMVTAVIMITVLIITMSAPQAQAASGKTKKMTVYDEVIVKGKYAYVSARLGIYKVNLKSGSARRIVKAEMPEFNRKPSGMKLKRGYLYYFSGTGALNDDTLYRIKTSGKKNKRLADAQAYAVGKKKIYYITYGLNPYKYKKKQMKLNGKSKKASRYKVKNKYKKSNKKGYYVSSTLTATYSNYEYDEYGDYYLVTTEKYNYYLVTPSGKRIYLCSYSDEQVEY